MPPTSVLDIAELREELPTLVPAQPLSAPSMATDKPFNSMGLPIELHLMIYERIPCQTHHTRVILQPTDEDPSPQLLLLHERAPLQYCLRRVQSTTKPRSCRKSGQRLNPQQPLRIINSRDVALEVVDRVINGVLESNAAKDYMFESKCSIHMNPE
jgi:hypothetical protein